MFPPDPIDESLAAVTMWRSLIQAELCGPDEVARLAQHVIDAQLLSAFLDGHEAREFASVLEGTVADLARHPVGRRAERVRFRQVCCDRLAGVRRRLMSHAEQWRPKPPLRMSSEPREVGVCALRQTVAFPGVPVVVTIDPDEQLRLQDSAEEHGPLFVMLSRGAEGAPRGRERQQTRCGELYGDRCGHGRRPVRDRAGALPGVGTLALMTWTGR